MMESESDHCIKISNGKWKWKCKWRNLGRYPNSGIDGCGVWLRHCPKIKKETWGGRGRLITCRLHIWSILRGRHFQLFELLRFLSQFHTCHISPCGSAQMWRSLSWWWSQWFLWWSRWWAIILLMMIMEQQYIQIFAWSLCNSFWGRSCKCQLSWWWWWWWWWW